MDWDRMAWSVGYRKCTECGQRYHLSGTAECDCTVCINEGCSNIVNGDWGGECDACEDLAVDDDVTGAIVRAQVIALEVRDV